MDPSLPTPRSPPNEATLNETPPVEILLHCLILINRSSGRNKKLVGNSKLCLELLPNTDNILIKRLENVKILMTIDRSRGSLKCFQFGYEVMSRRSNFIHNLVFILMLQTSFFTQVNAFFSHKYNRIVLGGPLRYIKHK